MARLVLVTGGARSGKSGVAEGLVQKAGRSPVYIATATAGDDEMADRIARHRARRGPGWTLREEPLELAAALDGSDGAGPRLVDCLTLWLSNVMLDNRNWEAELARVVTALERQQAPVVLVTNEVGAGIVPENPLGRRYRDAAGLMNQRVAAAADEVWWVVAGCPVRVKPAVS